MRPVIGARTVAYSRLTSARPHRGLLRQHVGLGLTLGGDREIVLRLRGGLAGEQRSSADPPAARRDRASPRPWRAPRARCRARSGTRWDRSGRARRPASTTLPCSKVAFDHDAGHARTDFGDAHRRDAAGRLLGHHDFLARDRDHADQGRRADIGLGARASGGKHGGDRQSRPKPSTVRFRQHVFQHCSSLVRRSRVRAFS